MAKKHNVYELAKFKHRVDKAVWDGDSWSLTIENMETKATVHDKVDFVLVSIFPLMCISSPSFLYLSRGTSRPFKQLQAVPKPASHASKH